MAGRLARESRAVCECASDPQTVSRKPSRAGACARGLLRVAATSGVLLVLVWACTGAVSASETSRAQRAVSAPDVARRTPERRLGDGSGAPWGRGWFWGVALLASAVGAAAGYWLRSSRTGRTTDRAQRAAVVEERQRLARELHDAVTQTLFSASLIAEALPTAWNRNPLEGDALLQELRYLTRGALAEMRTLLLELRPETVSETQLPDLLHQLADAASVRESLPIEVVIEGEGTVPADVHVALYRIAQEMLNNLVQHARASQARVHLRYTEDGGFALSVSDDGCGFRVADVSPACVGLGTMRERAHAIGADLALESDIGRGTTVGLVWRPRS